MEVKARLKNAPLSAQKGRLVSNIIRNMSVSQALNVLRFTPKKGAGLMLKLKTTSVEALLAPNLKPCIFQRTP